MITNQNISPLFKVRKATKDDALIALKIRKEAILYHCAISYPKDVLLIWAEGNITNSFIFDIENKFYIVESHNEIVGTGMLDTITGHIDAIFVYPFFMRKGVATCMMTYLENLAKKSNLNKLTLDSTMNATNFYRKLGFVGDNVSVYKSPRGITLECVPMVKVI